MYRYITAFGETKLVVDWLDDPRCQVGRDTLRARIRRGFDLEWSISAPAKTRAENFGAYALAGAENPFSMQRAPDQRVPHPNGSRKTHGRDSETAYMRKTGVR
mgnify:FL=1